MKPYKSLIFVILLALTLSCSSVNFTIATGESVPADSIVQITARTTNSYVDATASIRDGINTLTIGGGGVLFFGPGKYLVRETIEIPSNIVIQGVGVGESGPTMIILGSDVDLDATGMALFSLAPGARNVAIKDIELRSMTPGSNVYPRYDYDRIQSEETTAVRISGSETPISNIQFQNIRMSNFTYGIDAGTVGSSDAVIENVTLKTVVSNANYLALRVNSLKARNWDVQNLNAVEMGMNQNGILLNRTGKMSFLQLSCASTNHDANLCIDIGQRSGAIYFTQAHGEGPSEGLRVRTASNHPIYLENSAIWGTVEQRNIIYTFANRYGLDDDNLRLKFTGNGAASTLYACRDVFTNGYPNPPETAPAEPYPGLTSVPTGCNFNVSAVDISFSTDELDFGLADWIISGQSPSSPILNVQNFGAVGDGVADDTAAFRDAMEQIDPNYWSASTIVVPAGTYKITDTITLKDGITFQGATGATIEFHGTSRPLFLINALPAEPIIKRGIGIRDLALSSANANTIGQQAAAIELTGDLNGVTGDATFSGLDISNFTWGIHVYDNPEFDSIAVRNLTLTNNNVGIEIVDDNVSNWNISNIQVRGMKAGQRGVILDRGGISIRNLSCVGESSSAPAEACMTASRHSGLRIDGLTSENTKYAFYAPWPMGWTPFPVIIKNSDLTDGFYAAGKMYLLSVSNEYSSEDNLNVLGSGSVYFNVLGSDDNLNVYPASESRIASCGDTFVSSAGARSATLKFTGLLNTPQTCTQTTSGGGGGGGGGGGSSGNPPGPTTPPVPTIPPPGAGHGGGSLITGLGNAPTVWLIENLRRRPFTSAEVFMSNGYKWSSIITGNSADEAYPMDDAFTLASGALIQPKGTSKICIVYPALSYRCFSSYPVFQAMGYRPTMSYSITQEFLNNFGYHEGDAINSVMAHPIGTDINDRGTIYWISGDGRMPYPSLGVYNTWHTYENDFSRVVPANDFDRNLPQTSVSPARTVGQH